MDLFQLNPDSMKTRQELVTDAIRFAILRGRFHPGDRLDQSDLATELKVSRSPVRESLRLLTAEGLITHYPHRGTIVTERSIEELEEMLFIRKLLEGAAIERAMEHITDDVLETLDGIINEADSTDEVERALILNNTFHTTIYNAYQQPVLVDEIQKMRNKVAPYNRLYLDGEGHKSVAWADHRRIYEACCEHNTELAIKETHRHLERVFHSIIAELE